MTQRRPKATLAEMRTRPPTAPVGRVLAPTASCRAASAGTARSRKAWPSGVMPRRRLVRWNRRTPSAFSKPATFLLTAAGVRPSRAAAAVKLPAAAASTTDSSPCRFFMGVVSTRG